jgi:hypothetical protein
LQNDRGFSILEDMGKPMKNNISSKDLIACAEAASKRAVERAQAMNIPYTVQEGRKIVQHLPDGTTKVVEMLDKAYAVSSEKCFHIA